MVLILGSEDHRDFTEAFYATLIRYRPDTLLFFYKKTVFKGFSCGEKNIGEHKTVIPQDMINKLESDKDVILIVRGESGTWNSDAIFMETCQLVDTLKSGGLNMQGKKAGRLCLVLPREGYVKQDHVFRGEDRNIIYGESLTSALQRKVLKSLGADLLITLYPHDFRPDEGKEGWIKTASKKGEPEKVMKGIQTSDEDDIIQDWTGFAWAANPVQIIPDYFINNGIRIDAVIAPDKGAYGFSKFIADKLKADCSFIDSHRSRKDANIITSENSYIQNLSGKSVLIPDDFILAGGKTKHAIDALRPKGRENEWPAEIHVVVIHGEMTGNTYEELMEKNIRLYCTNSIRNPAGKMDVSSFLAKRTYELFLNKYRGVHNSCAHQFVPLLQYVIK